MNRNIPNIRALVLCVLVAVAAAAPAARAGANLLANPGFEDAGGSYIGWFTFGSGVQLSTAATDNIMLTGAAASKIYGGFVNCPGTGSFNVGGYGQAFTPAPGLVYEFSGSAFMSVVDTIPGANTCQSNRCLAKIVFFNAPAGGAEIASNEIVIGDFETAKNQWKSFSVSAPAPAGAQRVEALILFLQPGCDGGSVFVDDLALQAQPQGTESNVLANPSFSPGLGGWTTFGNVFPEGRAFATRTPSGSAKLFSTFVLDSPSGLTQRFSAVPGSTWRLRAHALTTCQEDAITATNDNTLVAKIVFRDAGDIEIGSQEIVLVDNDSPLGTWTRGTTTATAPVGTVAVEAFVLFVSPTLMGGAAWVDDIVFQEMSQTDVRPAAAGSALELRPNAPNPFRTATYIDFNLPARDLAQVAVFDVGGRRVATLFDGPLEAGVHGVSWNGRSASGAPLPAGVYRCVLTTSSGRVSRNLVLSK